MYEGKEAECGEAQPKELQGQMMGSLLQQTDRGAAEAAHHLPTH